MSQIGSSPPKFCVKTKKSLKPPPSKIEIGSTKLVHSPTNLPLILTIHVGRYNNPMDPIRFELPANPGSWSASAEGTTSSQKHLQHGDCCKPLTIPTSWHLPTAELIDGFRGWLDVPKNPNVGPLWVIPI